MKRQMLILPFFLFAGLGMLSCDKDEEKVCEVKVVQIDKLESKGNDTSITYDDVVGFKDDKEKTDNPKELRGDAEHTRDLLTGDGNFSKGADAMSDCNTSGYDEWYECSDSRKAAYDALNGDIYEVKSCD